MIFEISAGAVLGYICKEMLEMFKTFLKNRNERKRAYFEKKVEITISSIKILNATIILIHNCALSLKMMKQQFETENMTGLIESTRIFLNSYKATFQKANEFPHELYLFYNLPTFDTIFGQFNEMLSEVINSGPISQLPTGDSPAEIAEIERITNQSVQKLSNLVGFIKKIEEKEKLLERCLKDIQEQFKKYE